MQWEKKICFRLTMRRIIGAVLMGSTVANLVIVGAVFGADSPIATRTVTSTSTPTDPHLTATFDAPTSTAGEMFPSESTETPSPTPTDTFTPTDALMEPPEWIACVKRFYWQTYRVQPGDTLFLLARLTASSVEELMSANCLPNDQIYIGQVLHVPRLPGNTPTPTNTPTATLTDTATATPTNTPTVTLTDTLTATPTNTVTPAPDLVVTVLQVTGSADIVTGGQAIVVPIHVIVQNQGRAFADVLKLSAHYSGLLGKFVAPFTVPGQADIWYPYTDTLLAGGQQAMFTGTVTLPGALQGQTIALSVIADSCSGDEFMPADCRVAESNEDNNESQPVEISLPSNYPPSVAVTSPKNGSTYVYDSYDEKLGLWYKVVSLSVIAADPEDDVISESSLVWSTDQKDIHIDVVLGNGTNVEATLYSNICSGVWHTITLAATDSNSNMATDAVRIFIGPGVQQC